MSLNKGSDSSLGWCPIPKKPGPSKEEEPGFRHIDLERDL